MYTLDRLVFGGFWCNLLFNLSTTQVMQADILPDYDILRRDILGFTVSDFAINGRRVQRCWYSEHDIGSGDFIAKICLDRDRIGNLSGTEFVDSCNYAQRKLHVRRCSVPKPTRQNFRFNLTK